MEYKNILEQVQEIFRDQLDNDAIILKDDTTANDIEEWDSLSHIMLVVAVEKHFKIRFASNEILSWDTISDMINAILKKKE